MAFIKLLNKKYKKLNKVLNYIRSMKEEAEKDLDNIKDHQSVLEVEFKKNMTESKETEDDMKSLIGTLKRIIK